MKIFTWMQNKFNGRHEISKEPSFISASQNIKQDRDKDGFSERHVGSLLAIGTLGLNTWKEAPERSINDLEGNSSSSRQDHDLQDLTLEELGKLQNELNLILQKQAELTRTAELERNSFEWKKLLEKDSCIDSDKSTSCNDCNHQHSTSIIRNRGKDVCLDSNSKRSIGKKSLSFLLKKMFLCSSGITPAPSLRDHAVLESRMEKILRALILHKKIYPQSSSTALSMKKKYLDHNRLMMKLPAEDDQDHKVDNGSKWVNTDSEYIVLEI